MPLSPSSVTRAVDPSGDEILTFDTANGKAQGAVIVDDSGAQVIPLTDSQLRADPLSVSAESLPLPSGAATETTVAAVSAATLLAAFGTCYVDAASATVTYVGKEDAAAAWMVQRVSVSGNVTTIEYATATNNGAVLTLADAWAARATTLVFNSFGVAF